MTSEIAAAAERRRSVSEGREIFAPMRLLDDAYVLADAYLADLKYAQDLFKILAPQCEPMDNLNGVISQIDNWCAGKLPPADDAEPVTEEWLRSVGWNQWDATDGNDDFDLWLPANSELGWPCRLAWCVNGLYVVRMVDDETEDYLGTAESVELLNSRNRKKTITRGDVRALLRALKITLTEKDAHAR